VKIYVASKFENSKSVKEAYLALRDDGHTITHDWTNESSEGMDGAALEAYLQGCADKDVEGVETADALLLLNHNLMAGGFTEFGIAIGAKKFIVVIDGRNPEKPRNIFFHLHYVHHARNLAEAREILKAHDLFLTQESDNG
jgi:hypothetical protein